jgi:putative transposase
MVRLLKITRQGYYKQIKVGKMKGTESEAVKEMILSQRKNMPRLGGLKVYHLIKPSLESAGIKLGRDKLFDLMRYENLLVKKRKNHTRTTNSYHRFRKYRNLIQGLEITRPEQVWASDITYIRTKNGFMYLSLITDVYSKKVVGFELSDNLKTENSLKALRKAINNRETKKTLIHHSDRGLQYCSPDYTNLLEENHIKISMTSKYDPYENAVAERVNGILKNEFLLDKTFINEQEAKREVSRSIFVYNTLRPHLSCNYLSPNQAHKYGNYKLKTWKRKFFSKEASLEKISN